MDVTLLYNGPHVQRRKMFTLSPRNNLVSQIQIDWRDSLHEQQLSPLSRLRNRQSLQIREVGQKHNRFVDSYLVNNLNLTDSRIRKIKPLERANSNGASFSQKQDSRQQRASESNRSSNNCQQSSLKLPKIMNEEPLRQKNTLSEIINARSNNYLARMLRDRLRRYDVQQQKS